MRTSSAALSLALLVTASGCPRSSGTPPPPDLRGGPTVMMCPHASAPAGPCTVTAGGAGLLLTGTVLVPGQILRGGQVFVDGSGVIQCAACDCAATGAGATQVSCPSGVISPGLINTHDHLGYTQNSPPPDSGERYEQRNDWRIGERGHTRISYKSGATSEQIRFGELRFVMGGATSSVSEQAATGLLRNLDRMAYEEAPLMQTSVVNFDTFPLGDTAGQQLASGCAYPTLPDPNLVKTELAYEPHLSEGIDVEARNEFLCTNGGQASSVDIALPESAYIHAIALGAADYQHMASGKTSLIWSPRSNLRLYGNTAMTTTADRLGLNIALGTDWLLSGSMSLLRELACADAWNASYLDHYFSDEKLWLMVTANAARATHDDALIGTLAKGLIGDIAIFDGSVRKDHRAVIGAGPGDVQLVLRAGKPLYGDAAIITALGAPGGCDSLSVCGSQKSVCLSGDVGEDLAALTTNAGNIYSAFYCDTPPNEPTCVPARPSAVNGSTTYDGTITAGDRDGDGIADGADDCPTVFNPIRPLDNGKQADADGDGAGDACDAAPLDPKRK